MSGSSQGNLSSPRSSFTRSVPRPALSGTGSGTNTTASSTASSGPDVGVAREREPARLQRASIERYIDKVATQFKLAPHFRLELHAFGDDVYELSPEFWGSTIRQMAALYRLTQSTEVLGESQEALKAEIGGVKVQLTKRFVISDEQMEDILLLCKALVVEGGRDDFDFHDEALDHLKDASRYPRFTDVFKSKASVKNVLSAIRRQSSYVRNSYRGYLRDTVFDIKKKCGVTVCVKGIVRKYLDGDRAQLRMVFQVLILRKYIRDHPVLVARKEPEPGEDEFDNDSSARPTKCARLQPHFWAEFSAWMKEKYQDWGEDFRQPLWAKFIDECAAEERRLFPDDKLLDLPQHGIGNGHQGNEEIDVSAVDSDRRIPSPSPPPRSPRSPLPPRHPRLPRSPRSPPSRSPRSPRYTSPFSRSAAANGPPGTHTVTQPFARPGTPFTFSYSPQLPPLMNVHAGTKRPYAPQGHSSYYGHASSSGSQPRLPSMSATFGGKF